MSDDHGAVLARIAQEVARVNSARPLALRLCLACVDILGAGGGAITLAYSRQERVTLATGDHTAARLEDLQEVLGEGPGWDAFDTGRSVSGDLEGPQQWAMFSSTARQELGPHRLTAVPMRVGRHVIGVLTIYQSPPHADLDLPLAEFLADTVAATLLREADLGHGQLPAEWPTRARIHQATGMVVAQLQIPPGDAMALLRAHAYAHGVSLDEIATAVLERRLDFAAPDHPDRNEDS